MAAESGTTIETLQIQIESDSTNASNGLDALKNSLEAVKNAVKGGIGLKSVGNQLTSLNTALSSFDYMNAQKLEKTADALNKLSTVGTVKISSSIGTQISNISTALNGMDSMSASKLSNLATGLSKLSGLGNITISSSIANQLTKLATVLPALDQIDYSGVQSLVDALQPLSSVEKTSGLNSVLNTLNKLPDVATKLNSIDWKTLTTQLEELSSALEPLSTQLSAVSTAFQNLPSKIQKLYTTTQKLTTVNNKATTSYVNLYAKIRLVKTALTGIVTLIADAITESNDYIENMNIFTVALGEYADEAYEYAETVSDAMGIDVSEWIRYQAVFQTITEGFGVAADRAYTISTNLTQLGYDLASFFNLDVDEAMEKLESGISGELEPLRRLGFDLSQARLEQEMLNLGIEESFSDLTQAEKAQLRYYTILNQVTDAQGDMARTLSSPANQLRILKAQFTQCARAIGNLFIPALNAILPAVTAVIKVIRVLAEAIAALFGVEIATVDYDYDSSSISSVSSDAEDATDALEDTASAAADLNDNLLGIDELNVISPDTDTGSSDSGSDSSSSGSDWDFDLPSYDFLSDAVSSTIDEWFDKLSNWLGLNEEIDDFFDFLDTNLGKITTALGLLATALAAAKLAEWVAGLLGVSDILGALSWMDKLQMWAGFLLILAGAITTLYGAFDALENGLNLQNLATMIVGIGTAALGAYLFVSPLSSELAIVAAEVAAAAGALIIFGVSIADINENGAGLLNTVTAIGSLAAAVVLCYNAFSGLNNAWLECIAPLVGLIGSITLLNTGLDDGLENGWNAYNMTLTLVGGIGAVVSAVWLVINVAEALGVTLGVGGVVVTAILATIGVLITIADAFEEAGEAAYQSTDDYLVMEGIITRSEEAIENCQTAIENLDSSIETLNSTSEDFVMASALVDEIYEINDNADATNYDLELMAVKVDILNGLNIDGLSLSIDETTGRVVEAREETEALIESLQREAQMEAVQDLLTQAYKDQYQALADAQQALVDYDAASIALEATSEELANTKWYEFEKISELSAAQKEQTEAVEAAQEAYSTAAETYDTLTSSIDLYSDMLIDLKEEEAGVGDGFVEGLDDASTALTDWETMVSDTTATMATDLYADGEDIAEGLLNGVDEGTKENEYVGIWQKIGNWFCNLFGIQSPSTVFYEYGEYVNEGFVNGLDDSSSSSQLSITTWAKNIKTWFTGEDSGAVNADTFTGYAEDIISAFQTGVTGAYETVQTSILTWGSSVLNWFTNDEYGAVNTNSWETFATDIVTSFKDKINTIYTNVKSAVDTWTTNLKNWFTKSSYGGINETTFGGYASDIISAFKTKVSNVYTTVKSSITTWANNVKSWFTDIASKDSFYTIASNVIEGFKNGIGALASSTLSAISSWASSVVSTFKSVLGVSSPSKVFSEVGGYTVEGFNEGIEAEADTTKNVLSAWYKSFEDTTPVLSLDVDTSALSMARANKLSGMITDSVGYSESVNVNNDDSDMQSYMASSIIPLLIQIVDATQTQADKSESTTITLNGRELAKAITNQKKANGYAFVG